MLCGNRMVTQPPIHVDKKNPHCAMFIRIKFAEEENYLMYMYPDVASSNIHAKSIEQLKGVFHAAYGGSVDVLGAPLTYLHLVPSSYNQEIGTELPGPSMVASRKTEDFTSLKANIEKLKLELQKKQNLIVTYKLIHEDLMFILVLPHTYEIFVSNYMHSLYELLKFTNTSIEETIANPKKHAELDVLFNRFFQNISQPSLESLNFLNSFSTASPCFSCSFQISQLIDYELNVIESSFHSKDLMKTPHACFIIGACLFHAGFLIASHLSPKLTRKIILFLQVMNYLQNRSDHPESIIVQEIFYEEKKNPFGLLKPNEDQNSSKKKQYLLVILLQGSQVLCSILSLRHNAFSQQDPYFVNEMRHCLQRMHNNNIFAAIERQMVSNKPLLADPTSLLVRSRQSKLGRTIPYSVAIDSTTMEFICSATKGPYNVLFNYIIHSQAQGSIIFPATLSDGLRKIEPHFIKYCGIIRNILSIRRQQLLLNDDLPSEPQSTTKSEQTDSSKYKEEPILEYGIHVEDSESFAPQTIGYWVVGAMLSLGSDNDNGNLTEIFVCYEDSIPQNIVDIAYRMASSIV